LPYDYLIDAKVKRKLSLLPREMMSGGMVTLERVQVIEYRHAEREE